MDWSSVAPILTVVLATVVVFAGALLAVTKLTGGDLAARMDARFDLVDARFDSVDARFDAVDARFDLVDARFDAVDHKFGARISRVDDIDRRLDEYRIDLRTVTERVDRLIDSLPSLQPS